MLTADHEDMLTELVNIGIGRAAYTLSEMVDTGVGLRVPRLRVEDPDRPAPADPASASVVVQSFTGGVSGSAQLAIKVGSARKLVAVLTDVPSESIEIDAEREAVITEVANIVINSVLGSFGNLTALDLVFGLPRYEEMEGGAPRLERANAQIVSVSVLFQIQSHSIEGELSVAFEVPTLVNVWEALLDAEALVA